MWGRSHLVALASYDRARESSIATASGSLSLSGDSYYGGRWDRGVFFYNRTVNNFTNVRITNVYNQTVMINNNVSRVSFNGGSGGIQARPTSQREALARERHIEATPVQCQHAEIVSKDRSLFSRSHRFQR
jgi:hypothetical protein